MYFFFSNDSFIRSRDSIKNEEIGERVKESSSSILLMSFVVR